MRPHNTPTLASTRQIDYAPNGTVVQDVTGPIHEVGRDQVTMFPYPNPGNKQKPTTFEYTAVLDQNYMGNYTHIASSGIKDYYVSGDVIGTSVGARYSIEDFTTYHYNRALDRLNDKVRGQLDLGLALAEFGQTKRMFGSLNKIESYLGNTLRGYNVSRGGKLLTPKKLIKGVVRDLGSNWLMWQYGIKPLMMDVYNSYEELRRDVLPGLTVLNSKSYERIDKNQRLSRLWMYDPFEFSHVTGIQGVAFKMRFDVGAKFDIARWTSLNPVSFAYELLTLSFVIDWVYNIGSMIRSLETALLYNQGFVDGYWSFLYTHGTTHSRNNWRNEFQTNGSYQIQTSSSTYKVTRFKRTVLGSYPLPRLPQFKVDLGWQRLVSAASLLAQQIR